MPFPDGPMAADIARQPAVLRTLLARADEFAAFGAASLAPAPGGRVVVTGCGDGLFAAAAMAGFARDRLGLAWCAEGAMTVALGAAGRLGAQDRVLAISMSGNVDRTVEAATAAAASGARVAVLCNGAGGRLGQIAAARVSLDIADLAPFLCGTTSYTATLLALALIAAGAAGAQVPHAGLAAAIDAVAASLVPDIAAIAGPAPRGVRILTAGADTGTAQYGAAKLVELTRTPAWAGDIEEFAHSQFWAVERGELIIMLAPSRAIAAYANANARALGAMGLRVVSVETAEAPVPAASARVGLGPIDADVAPIASAVVLQRLAHHIARATGFDPDTRRHLKDDGARFAASRAMTRRSLLGTGL